MKNEKFLLDIQTKCSNMANKILNAEINAEQAFKCKWPHFTPCMSFESSDLSIDRCSDLSINNTVRLDLADTKIGSQDAVKNVIELTEKSKYSNFRGKL